MTRQTDTRGTNRGSSGQPRPEGVNRFCDHPECLCEGLFRAPRAPDSLKTYYWFCLEHVREYNAAWNYCANMTVEEMDAHVRRDTVWERPSWSLGLLGAGRRPEKMEFDDPIGVFNAEQARQRADFDSADPMARHYRTLDLRPPVTLTALKSRYKELGKRLHPDRNGGDRKAEERLKAINEAYSALKKAAAL